MRCHPSRGLPRPGAAVPVQNSLMYYAALHKHKVPCTLHVFEKGRHGIYLAEGHAGGVLARSLPAMVGGPRSLAGEEEIETSA